ncbi:hypothetical protein ABXV03_02185 [Streptomyces harbinensis]|uniref:hypothetical protein n=1 Tax=Streptomyces harbinensis TaxID=1176198 RepID=UPI0033955CDB
MNRTVDIPIEELHPGLIGMAMEVGTHDGTSVGFRLARYEKSVRDGRPTWLLFSAGHPWRVEVHGGSRIRCVMKFDDGGRPHGQYAAQVPPTPATAPPLPTAPPSNPPVHTAWMPPVTRQG